MVAFDHTQVNLTIDKGKLTARLSASPTAIDQGLRAPAYDVLAFLRQQGLVDIDEAAVTAWAEAEDQTTPVIVARGAPPTAGDDGRVEYVFQEEQKEHSENRKRAETVDYKDWFSLPTVRKGEVLAHIHPPAAGTDGTDVFGTRIPFKPGRIAKIKAGKNVEIREADGVAVSAVDGLVVFRGRMLEVSPTYVVNGDVNLRSGNIRFNGDVLIRGDVLEDFLVEATGSVTIQKTVHKGSVKADGSITVKGGIYGKEGVSVDAGEDLTVHHVENGTLHADGAVVVTQSAVQSWITGHTITIGTTSKGYVRGGELKAISDIVVTTVGSPAVSAMTRICVDWDRSLIAQMCAFRDRRDKLDQDRRRYDEQIEKLRKMIDAGRTLTGAQMRRLEALEEDAEAVRTELATLQAQKAELEERVLAARDGTITVRVEMHPDAILAIHGKELLIDEAHGPLRLQLGKDRLELLPVEAALSG